jgi:alpha-1,3-rhamnosyl/mannosyltransferase
LVEAVGLLRDRGKPIRLVVVGGDGDPHYSRLLRSEISRLGLEGHVTLAGEVSYESMSAHYGMARAFVLPSYLETFGHPLVEAMSAGLAVAASDIPVFRELAAEAVEYFNPFDAKAIAATMARVDGDGPAQMELAKRGFARSAMFSWRTTALRTVEVLEEAAACGF